MAVNSVLDFLPLEITSKINLYAYQSLNEINPKLYEFINNFDYTSHFTFNRRMEFAKKISRMRVRRRVRETVARLDNVKKNRLAKKTIYKTK